MEKISRRKFVDKSAKVFTIAGLSAVGISEAISAQKEKNMFVHQVYFWMKPEASKDERDKLFAGIQSISKIETVRIGHVGVPADTDRPVIDKSYAFSLLTVFDDKKGHDIYQEHPIHKKFIADCQTLWTKVQVYDSVNRS